MPGKISPKRRLAVAGITTACVLAAAVPAAAQTGGSGPPGGTTTTTTTTDPSTPMAPPGRAKLLKDGTARAPVDAPPAIQAALNAGNQIHTYPYHWGGGHQTFYDSGYDCSGAVSYVLHAAGFLASPMPSGPLASSWGTPGKGRWITVYANAGHAYMVVAGLRFDTSGRSQSGSRWQSVRRSSSGYVVRHPAGL